MRIACVQMTSRDDKAANLEQAERLVGAAAAMGAEVVLLPEKWNYIGDSEGLHAAAEPIEGGESVEAMSAWATGHGITLVGGSITERREGRDKLSNTCLVFDPDGSLQTVYRKIHMFDVEVGGLVYRESEAEESGEEPVLAHADGWKLGLTICYDVRFPELYRALAVEGAELFTVPSHFTLHTGRDHWEVLLRSRAIENTSYLAAAAQIGETRPGRPSYGRSMIVDPWGLALAQAPDEETVVAADVERSRLEDVRRNLPSLASRRPEAYEWRARA